MNKSIVFIIASLLLLNNITICSDIPSVIGKPVIHQSLFQTMLALKSVFNLLDDTMRKDTPLCPRFSSTGSDDTRSTHSRCNDWLMPNSNTGTGSFLNGIRALYNEVLNRALSVVPASDTSPPLRRQADNYFALLFLLAYFILLRRRNLPWELTLSSNSRNRNPIMP